MSSRISSPAHSQGAKYTPRRYKPRASRSVGSPARSATSVKLSNVVMSQMNFELSPLPARRSVLADTTEIDAPRRASWWKKLNENSQEVMEVINNKETVEANVIEEFIEGDVASQEKENYTLDLPESSDNESINSIVIPQRRLFTQKDNQQQHRFAQVIDTRKSLTKFQKSYVVDDNALNVGPKNLFNHGTRPRNKPIFPSGLLNISANKTLANKTKELTANEVKGHVKSLFGSRPGTKRKNMFIDFILSDSENEIPEIQPKIFGFKQVAEPLRKPSSSNYNQRESSQSSITDIEIDDWRLLPSSTMVEHQIQDGLIRTTPNKRTRLDKLSEATESSTNKTMLSNKSIKTKNQPRNLSNSNKVEENAQMVPSDELEGVMDGENNRTRKSLRKTDTSLNNVTHERSLKSQTKFLNKSKNNANKSTDMTDKIAEQGNKHNNHELTINQQICNKHNNSKNISQIRQENKGVTEDEENQIDEETLTQECHIDQNHVQLEKEQMQDGSEDNNEDISLRMENDDNEPDVNDRSADDRQDIADEKENLALNDTKASSRNAISKEKSQLIHQNESETKKQDAKNNNQNVSNGKEENGHDIDHYTDNKEKKTQEAELDKSLITENIDTQDDQNDEVDYMHTSNHSKEIRKDDVEGKDEDRVQGNSQIVNNSRVIEHENEMQTSRKNVSKKLEPNICNEIKDGEENKREMHSSRLNVIQEKEPESGNEMDQDYGKEDENRSSQETVIQEIEPQSDDEIKNDDGEREEMQSGLKNLSQEVDHECANEMEMDVEDREEAQTSRENDSQEIKPETDNEMDNDDEDREETQTSRENDSQEIELETDNEMDNDKEREKMHSSRENYSQEIELESNNEMENDDEEMEELHSSRENVTQEEEPESDDAMDNNDEEREEMHSSGENVTQEIEPESDDEIYDDDEINADEDTQEDDDDQNQDEIDNEDVNDGNVEKGYNSGEEDEVRETEKNSGLINGEATNRHRKEQSKVASPEILLKNVTNEMEIFEVQKRHTSVRKTKSIINPLNIRRSPEPARESTGFSDGPRDSSAEGSGWDSHRTTRVTLRKTFGKDFTPRKSLRTLVMEKSAKRQTMPNFAETNAEISKFPQANSTEFPIEEPTQDEVEDDNINDVQELQESNHEASRRQRQATLEMYLQKVKKQNMEQRKQLQEQVKTSLKTSKEAFSFFKVISAPKRRAPIQTKPKAKKKTTSVIPLDMIPSQLLEDMKYRPPKRYRPPNASWITNRLYKFLENKLEPKYNYKARVRSEKLVEMLYEFTKSIRRHTVAPAHALDELKHVMARLQIVKTHYEFNEFFHEFMPREVRVKVVPDVFNNIPLPRHGIFSDILQ